MEGLENIKRRLKKLMALYESAKKVDSEGEAAACAEATQRILTQYNLTMDEVDLGTLTVEIITTSGERGALNFCNVYVISISVEL